MSILLSLMLGWSIGGLLYLAITRVYEKISWGIFSRKLKRSREKQLKKQRVEEEKVAKKSQAIIDSLPDMEEC